MFLQENEDDHPVGLAPSVEIILVERGDAEELEDLVFVDVLAHVAHDVRLQIFQLEKFAKIYEVKLILVCESQIVRSSCDMLQQVLNVLIVLTSLQACFIIYDDLDLCGVFAVLLTFGLVYINGVEDGLIELERVPLTSLDELVGICVHR